jgi:cell division protein FtsB
MAEEKKRSMIPMVIAVMLFVVGLILGYYIWGINKEKQVDYKKFLAETVNYIATLEHKNKKLLAEVDTLETELNMLQQKQAAGTQQDTSQMDGLSQRITVLEEENRDLKSALTENNRLAQENQELKSRIQGLIDEKNAGGVPVEPSAPDKTDQPSSVQ